MARNKITFMLGTVKVDAKKVNVSDPKSLRKAIAEIDREGDTASSLEKIKEIAEGYLQVGGIKIL